MPAMTRNAWRPRSSVRPVANRREKSERATWAIRRPAADDQNEGDDRARGADETQLLADPGEHQVADDVAMQVFDGRPSSQSRATDASSSK